MARRGVLGLAALGLAGGAAEAQTARPAAGRPQAPAQAASPLNLLVGTEGWFFRAHEPRLGLNNQGFRNVTGLVGEAAEILRRGGVRVALSLSPLRARTYRDYLPAGVQLTPETEARYGSALKALRATGNPMIDLAAAYAGARGRPDAPLLFFKTDTHWTPAGAALAAAEMAALVKAQVPLPPSTRPGVRLDRPVLDEHMGNLLMLMPEEMKRRTPYEPLAKRRIIPAAGAALDDTPPDVLAVGSSYMHPEWGYAPELSQALDRPVGLTWAVHPMGPYRTLLRAVSTPEFRQRRPALLVWHLLEDDVDVEPTRDDVWRGHGMTAAAFLSELRQAVGG